MKLIAAWILGVIVAGAGAYAYDSYRPSLPYTEPHHEFQTPEGEDYVAWRFSNGAVVGFCEGHPPILRTIERKCGLDM